MDSVVVLGVNDPPPGAEDPDAPASDDVAASAATAPLSPAALADLRARAARYGDGQVLDANLASAAPPQPAIAAPAGLHARAFDASEGTRLDPLRNKTFDLLFSKDVPANFK